MSLKACAYGDKCRRRNPEHWEEESHPNMTFGELPVLSCKFGSECKDASFSHRLVYEHPTKKKAETPDKKRKRPKDGDDPPRHKKQKTDKTTTPLHTMDEDEEVKVESSSKVGEVYRMTLKGGIYRCTCTSWKMQKQKIDKRTCKHLKKYLGIAFEEARTQTLTAGGKVTKIRDETLDVPPLLLAEKPKPEQDLTGWWFSEKLDGVRAFWDGTQFVSRLGNKYHAPAWFTKDLPTDVTLDGELFVGRKMFHKTVSIAKSLDAGERWKTVKYHVFDVPSMTDEKWESRMEFMLTKLKDLSPYVHLVEQKLIPNMDTLAKWTDSITEQGAEGAMAREPGSLYVGKRSDSLLKIKKFFDIDVKVKEHLVGKGRNKARCGSLLCEMDNGKTVKVGSGLTDEQRETPPPIGCTVTIKYQELSREGIPRFPTFIRIHPKDT